MGKTKIEWATHTWNPATGCTKVSAGCANCYAERQAGRFWGERAFSEVMTHPERLIEPPRWQKPRRVFVCSTGDLFHEDVPTGFISDVFQVMERCPQHIFMVLTKRPERMGQLLNGVVTGRETEHRKHIWLGVTAENQEMADKRIPILAQVPATMKFISVEPMLGPVDLKVIPHPYKHPKCEFPVYLDTLWVLKWVICGGESGPNARPCHPDWVRNLKDQCRMAGVPFLLKQMRINGKLVKMPELDGRIWDEYPALHS